MNLHTATGTSFGWKGLLRIPRRKHSRLRALQNRVPLPAGFMSLKAVITVTCGEAKTKQTPKDKCTCQRNEVQGVIHGDDVQK
jgi:hypothetical protein